MQACASIRGPLPGFYTIIEEEYMRNTRIHALLLLLAVIMYISANAQEKYALQYNFKNNASITYKIERQDSIAADFRGQAFVRQMTNYMLRTMAIEQNAEKNGFSVTVKTDSAWSDGQEQGDRNMRRGRMEAQKFSIDSRGTALSENTPFSLLLLPLPKNPVAVNDTWDFEAVSKTKGRRKGETTVKGNCLLYSVDEQDGDQIAVIIVNSTTTGKGSFSFRAQNMEGSGTFAMSGTGTALVYFNITNGYVTEVVSEEASESVNEMNGSSSKSENKSKIETKIVTG